MVVEGCRASKAHVGLHCVRLMAELWPEVEMRDVFRGVVVRLAAGQRKGGVGGGEAKLVRAVAETVPARYSARGEATDRPGDERRRRGEMERSYCG